MSVKKSEEPVFIDIQGFRARQPKFILKEFCLNDGTNTFHHIVESPFPYYRLTESYKRQALFLIKHHHGIGFDCGNITAEHLKEDIYPRLKNKTILVKGSSKVEWLNKFFGKLGGITCYNIEDIISKWEVKRDKEYECCEYHQDHYRWNSGICALSNTLKLEENWKSHLVSVQPAVESDGIESCVGC